MPPFGGNTLHLVATPGTDLLDLRKLTCFVSDARAAMQ